MNGVSFVARSCGRECVIRGAPLERMPSGTIVGSELSCHDKIDGAIDPPRSLL